MQYSISASARTFYAEGSDIMLGVGARNIALAGAVTSSTKDVYSTYWNPAGLAGIEKSEITISHRPGAELVPVNFLGAAFVVPEVWDSGWKMSYAFAFIPRLHIYGSGTFYEDEFESIFMRYALPGLEGDFTGTIESKTKDYRMAFGFSPIASPEFRAGFSIGYIDCATTFCGIKAESPGNYTIASAGATAFTFNFGLQYDYSEKFTFGLNVNDVGTTLDVEVIETDDSGTTNKNYIVEFPRDIALGMVWHQSKQVDISADVRYLSGKYGSYVIDFRTARIGVEFKNYWQDTDLQAGLLIPIKFASDKTEEFDIPYFAAPSVGVVYKKGRFKLESALLVEPVSSYQLSKPRAAFELSLGYEI